MPLKYNFTKGRPKSISEDECYNTCMWLMVCGVDEVTKENAQAVCNRINALCAVDSQSTTRVDVEAMKRFDGLSLNVERLSARKFLSKLVKDVELNQKKGK